LSAGPGFRVRGIFSPLAFAGAIAVLGAAVALSIACGGDQAAPPLQPEAENTVVEQLADDGEETDSGVADEASQASDSAPENDDCPGLSEVVCAHAGTHVYTQQPNVDTCPQANPLTEGTEFTITFEPEEATVHSDHFGWTFTLNQTGPATFEDDTRVWTFEESTITRTAKSNCIVYIMTRVD
jgi:hypothetical protein